MDSLVAAFFRAPPISRTFAAAVFCLTLSTVLGIVPRLIHESLTYNASSVWRFPPQPWRIFTNYFFSGSGTQMLFDPYILFTYLSQLEVGNPSFRRPADLLWYLTFTMMTILGISHLTGFSFMQQYLSPLLIAIAYTATQDQRGVQVTYFFFPIPAQLIPYAMLAFSLLFPNGVFMLMFQAIGLVAAHLFHFLTRIWPKYGSSTGRTLLYTPAWFVRLVDVAAARLGARQAGSGSSGGGAGGASKSGPLPDSWRTRGSGHRLG